MLTDTAARQAKPRTKPYRLSDEKGLYLEVHSSGSKYWRMKYRYAGKAGIEAARKRGKHLGRPRKLNATQLKHAKKLISDGTSRNEVARILDINPSTLYRNLQKTA